MRTSRALSSTDVVAARASKWSGSISKGPKRNEQSAGGTVSFTTVADSGTDAGSGPRAFRCPPSGLTVRSSIIWAPGTVVRAAIDGGCTLISTIVGPTPVPGAPNVDPRFVDAAGRDYRLSAARPARDMVDDGPVTDFEGDPRPHGARFEIGADEAR
jgi:hypothetical protein